MVTKKSLFNLIISFLALIAIAHTLFQVTINGTGISGFFKSGISGFSIGKIAIGNEFRQSYMAISSASKILIAIEWSLLLILIFFSVMKNKNDEKKELETIKLKEKYQKGKNTTDLDVLYEILKEKKHLKLKTIAKMFKIEKEIAKKWCETLESGELATLHYPRIGDPEIVINK